jgi:hypothetical protein
LLALIEHGEKYLLLLFTMVRAGLAQSQPRFHPAYWQAHSLLLPMSTTKNRRINDRRQILVTHVDAGAEQYATHTPRRDGQSQTVETAVGIQR